MAIIDLLPALIAIAAIWALVRWLNQPKTERDRETIPGVTSSMVASVHSAFPHVPPSNIIYHLSRSRSAQATSEEIIERGSLPNPPAGFYIPPSLLPPTVNPQTPNTGTIPIPGQTKGQGQGSLIDRYNLSSRVPSRKGKGKEVEEEMSSGGKDSDAGTTEGAGSGKWEDSREKRETGLRERKEKMILEARRRLVERQAKEETA